MISASYIDMGTFFVLSFAGMYVFTRFVPFARELTERLGHYLLAHAFPSDTENEHDKFAILRILFGLILLVRAVNVQWLLLPEERFALPGLLSALEILAAAMLVLGILTQLALAFFVFVMWHIGEKVLGTSTLGNDIAAILSLLFMLTSAGRYLSLDALIIKRWGLIRTFLFYTKAGPDAITIALAKFAALFSYWLVCVYSLSMHINEPAWTTGVAGPLLLSNHFMSAWYEWFETLFIDNDVATFISRVLLWIMMFWYAAVLPLTLLGGWWRKYVIIWGILFFTLSLVVLNLGSLAEIEFVFWAALFWPLVPVHWSGLIFDNLPRICRNTVRMRQLLKAPEPALFRTVPKARAENTDRPSIAVVAVVFHVVLLGSIYFASIPAPYLGISGTRSTAVNAASFYGITPIDVFNKTDLRMSENWFTLMNTDSNTHLPIFTDEGSRLKYHKSDRIYFGHTLRFRRGEIDHKDCAFERRRQSIEYLSRVWLHQSSFNAGNYHFVYTQYHQPLPDYDLLLGNDYIPKKSVIRCVKEYELAIP